MKKIINFVVLLIINLIILGAIYFCDYMEIPGANTMLGIIESLLIMKLIQSFIAFKDDADWKTSQTKLLRDKSIKDDELVRISFAYLFRIKIDGKYFLVKNERGTKKYQPVGGVYKFYESEAIYLRENFNAEDDDKIPIDESSKGDYRLRFKNKYLRKFIKRFNTGIGRECLENLSREFVEELFHTNIIDESDYGNIEYTYVGQHITKLEYGEHFQCYELLLADILHLEMSEKQEEIFRDLMNSKSECYIFATDFEIKSLGVKSGSRNLDEKISNHTLKILIENEDKLLRRKKKDLCKKYR